MEGGTRIGPYEIGAQLGAGGMGEVYRAQDTRLGRAVAIKVLPAECAASPSHLKRFEQEARAASALNHPNILTVFDFGSHEGTPYLVTELLEGETLRQQLLSGSLSSARAVGFARQVASGLTAAHEKGIVHRDIKPENLFVTGDGTVKILDFGLAKLACQAATEHQPPSAETTQTGTVLGTVGYMSPEQVRAQPVDGRADLFSLGCVLYEMLAGRRAFQGASHAETMSAILHDDPPPLRAGHKAITPALVAVVQRCLAKRPEDRFKTAHDLSVALETISVESGPAPARPGDARPWTRALAWLGAAIVAAAAVLVWSVLRHEEGADLFSSGTPRRLTSGPGWEAEPVLSPDGTLVAFTTYSEGGGDIFVADTSGGGEPLRLTSDPAADLHPAWLPDGGSLLFASDRGGMRSIWRIPRLGGSATLTVQDADYPAVSPDGRWVAFSRTASGGRRRIFVDLLDGTGEAACLTGERDGLWDHVDPAWSPDGRQLAYADQRDLWVVAASGGPARPLTSLHDNDRQPVWSADGQWVYFASKRGATDAVWRIASHGGTPQRVTMGTGPETHPDVSRDGTRLVYSTFSQQFDVTVVDLRAGTRFEIRSSVLDSMPTLSPDGSAVVFVSNRSGSYELWRQAIRNGGPDGPPVRLTDHGDNVALPAFSPDGAWVAYFRARGANRDIWMVPASGGSPVQVTEDPSQDLQPAFSPDGRNLAFVSGRSGREHVWIQPMAGSRRTGEPWQLTDGEDPDFLPVWSPDGTTMAFNRGGEIWLNQAARGSTPRRLTSDAGAQVLRWEPDGTSLLARGVWGGSELQLRRFRIADGMASAVDVGELQGGASEAGSFDLSRDGRILAIDHSEPGGDLWILEAKGARTR